MQLCTAELCEKFREKIYPARDTGRRSPIPGLSRGIRDGWQPYLTSGECGRYVGLHNTLFYFDEVDNMLRDFFSLSTSK